MTAARPQVLVVGGARRVGREIAIAFAKAGCDVVITFNQSEADASETRNLLQAHGGSHAMTRLELSDLAAMPEAAAKLAAMRPRWDIIVFSASTYVAAPLGELSVERLQADMAVNVLSPIIITQKLAPLMKSSALPHGAAIVAMIDIHAMGRPRNGFVSYACSKAALAEMVQSLGRELAPAIRVNGIAPGVIAWPEGSNENTEAEKAAYLKRVPMKREGTPQEAAEVVRWLALDASYVTGQIIRVDGGRWLA